MTQPINSLLETLCDDPSSCRERLLHTAGMMFADHGLNGVSTRELTKSAGANLSAIAYYFGSKEGLYGEAIAHTIAGTQNLIGGAEERLRYDVTEARGDRQLLAEAASRFTTSLLHALLGLGPENWPRRLLLREVDHPTQAFTQLFDAVFKPLFEAFLSLVTAATGGAADAPETLIRATALLGQCLTFYRNRTVVLRILNWDDFSPDHIETIAQVLGTELQDALELPRTHPKAVSGPARAAVA